MLHTDVEKVGKHYDVLSFFYDALDWPFERFRYPRIRTLMCGDVHGKVLDAGCGTGKNFKYFPSDVSLTAVDLSPGMLARARHRVAGAACPIELVNADATKLPYPDGYFDASVSTYMFCVLPDDLQLPAVKELLRVTKPGGQVRILEHRYSQRWWRRMLMKLYSPYVNYFWSSRYDHKVGEAVRASGGKIVEERFVTSDVEKIYFLKN